MIFQKKILKHFRFDVFKNLLFSLLTFMLFRFGVYLFHLVLQGRFCLPVVYNASDSCFSVLSDFFKKLGAI